MTFDVFDGNELLQSNQVIDGNIGKTTSLFEEDLQEHFFHLNASPFCLCQSKLWESWLWRAKKIKECLASARRATSVP